jgi:hypothetical protein
VVVVILLGKIEMIFLGESFIVTKSI